jgi:membrane-bound lytic murein transglycosylase D
MNSLDTTQLYEAPAVLVHVKQGRVVKQSQRYPFSFKIGRSEQSDLQFADRNVSSNHAEVLWHEGQWWLEDVGSKNGTYVNKSAIKGRIPLPVGQDVAFAIDGPIVAFNVEQLPVHTRGEDRGATRPIVTSQSSGIPSVDLDVPIGDRTRIIIGKAVAQVSRKHEQERKTYLTAIGAISVLLLCIAAVAIYLHLQVKRLEKLQTAAENIFYSTKEMELKLPRSQYGEFLTKQKKEEIDYERYLEELGISELKLGKETWLIHKMARLFGECDVEMPKEFVDSVKYYIKLWKSTGLYRSCIGVAQSNDYTRRITRMLEEQYLPRQFFYLALQESYFDTAACGPPIPKLDNVYAKGMWQFIPETARKYDLKTGPLLYSTQFDRADERLNFERSTRAAARYLRDLYNTEAQASGLLVMACYNWGEDRVLEEVKRMPKNPRERNFWMLMKNHWIPWQTHEYVFSILSAAVIGEDPRFFGFDFDNPLAVE